MSGDTPIRPTFHHFNLKTTRLQELVDWYAAVVGAEVTFQDATGAWLTNDVANHRIAIERGHLYRFLVLHEAAHLIVPEDRRHGPGFTFILQLLYRSFVGIPEEAVRHYLSRHGLPLFTAAERRLAA